MEYLKCRKCGGVIIKTSALAGECTVCGTRYSDDEIGRYESKTGYFENVGGYIEKCLYNNLPLDASDIANKFFENVPEELLPMACYDISYHLLTVTQTINNQYSGSFINIPWDSTTVDEYASVIKTVLDFLYSLSEHTNKRVDYKFIVNYFSYHTRTKVIAAWNYEVDDRWLRYTKDEDNFKELLRVGDNCIKILEMFDMHGDACLPEIYESIIYFHKQLLETTFTNEYWIGDYKTSEQAGLTLAAKAVRRDMMAKVETKLKRATNHRDQIRNEIRKEEKRIENEKKAKRVEEFWKNNQELKNSLLKEKDDLLAEIDELNNCIKTVESEKQKEIGELKAELKETEAALNKLGIFAVREKKEKRYKIVDLKVKIDDIIKSINKEKKEIQVKIDRKRTRINAINGEFTRDR